FAPARPVRPRAMDEDDVAGRWWRRSGRTCGFTGEGQQGDQHGGGGQEEVAHHGSPGGKQDRFNGGIRPLGAGVTFRAIGTPQVPRVRPGMRMTMQEQAWADALRRERAGDGSRYARFLEEYSTVLRRVVRSRLSAAGLDAQEAEDVVQEVLMAIHQRRDQWRDDRPLLPWLGAISRYKTIDVLRRRRSELHMRIDLSEREWADLFVAADGPAVDAAARVEHMVSALPRVEQSVVRKL